MTDYIGSGKSRLLVVRFNVNAWLRYAVVVGGILGSYLAGCTPSEPAAPTGACGQEGRAQLDCSTEFSYDSNRIEGGFAAFGVMLKAGTEQKALRDIDQQTAQYVAQARRLCDEYNKCVLDRETYALRSENLRRRLARVPELYDGLRRSTNEESRRWALSQAYSQLLPDEARTELELAFTAVAVGPGAAANGSLPDGASLRTGAHLRFLIQTSKPAHVYLFQRSADGKFAVLFPDDRMGLTNPVPGASLLTIPPGGGSFRVDERDVGEEHVYIIASLEALGSLGQEAARLQSTGAAPPSLLPLDRNPECATRALAFDPRSADRSCARQRGLILAAGAVPQSPSLLAKTEAADGVIARVFSFRHVN